MKSLVLGVAVAVATAFLGNDAAAGLADDSGRSLAPAGTVRGGMTLAKAKKKARRPAGPGPKAEPADDSSGAGDDSSSASSPASDDAAKEEEVFGSKKKKPAAPAEEDSSDGGDSQKAAPKPRPKVVESVESKASEEDETGSTASALEFGVGAKALFRQFAWTSDARAAGLGPYSLTPGPETGGWLEFYPAAFGTTGFAANIGLFGRFDYGFGVATTLANGDVVSTKFRDFLAGLKVRIPLGSLIPNASLAYGQQTFEIAQQGSPLDLPKLAYSFVRPALGTRVMFTPTVGLDVTAAYLMVLDPGSSAGHIKAANFFPNATSFGFELSASLAFRLSGAIGARAGADLRQYVISMNDTTAPTVGGAVDRYIVMWAGVEVVLDGQGGAAGDDEPAKPSKRKRRHAEPKSDDSESSSSESEEEE